MLTNLNIYMIFIDETTIEYPARYKTDKFLDEPEWGIKKNQPEISLKDFK